MKLLTKTYQDWIANNVVDPQYRCEYWSKEMVKAFPELKRIRGYFVIHNVNRIPHWWLEDVDGNVIDPTSSQFLLSNDCSYEGLDETISQPTGKCINCGEFCYTQEAFCSDTCAEKLLMLYSKVN